MRSFCFPDFLRRRLASATAALGLLAGPAIADGDSPLLPDSMLGEPVPFSFESLVERARENAAGLYAPPKVAAPEQLAKIDYDAHWKIVFREQLSLWPGGQMYPVQLFHPARYFPEPVAIHVLDGEGHAREVIFSPAWFDEPDGHPARGLPEETGFAGFRVMRTVPADGSEDGPEKGPRTALGPDWISFLGASYFRADGPFTQYGISVRGIAIDTGLPSGEEFPRFDAFWIGPPEEDEDDLTVYALLNGPSITGAYRMGLDADGGGPGQGIRVEARLFARHAIERLGVAPLTSMYWYSERDRLIADDWRPEIHDSDGLAIETGSGERIWRPLRNPEVIRTSSFQDTNPRGFGLIQRDRIFDHYQDDGVYYDRRPAVWVTPIGDWGEGWVQLVELPTVDETMDNIVAYWTPKESPKAGDEMTYSYRLRFTDVDPDTTGLARVVATRQGQGGIPGQEIPKGIDKMVVDFAGGPLDGLDRNAPVEAVIDIRGGEIVGDYIPRLVRPTGEWRISFDYRLTGTEPADIRVFLRKAGEPLTETWLGQAKVDRGE